MIETYVLAYCRAIIGIVFLLSFLTKARNISQFAQTIKTFRLMPNSWSHTLAILFLACEFVIVIFVMAGDVYLETAFLLAIGLLLLFSFALVSLLRRHLQIACNCFGSSVRQVTTYDVWRNAGIVVCAAAGFCVTQLGREPAPDLSFLAWVLVGITALVFVIVWINLSEVLKLLQTTSTH